MSVISKRPQALFLLAMLAVPASGLAAQDQDNGLETTVSDTSAPEGAQMTEGPDIEGIISARSGDKMKVTASDGTSSIITINDQTEIRGRGGFLGLASKERAAASLLNGLPVSVKTAQWGNGLVARQIKFRNNDFKTAAMIHNGTDQRFAEQSAATDALRSRMGDIDKYNIKSTTNVNFDTGKAVLSEQAKSDLCMAASTAEGMDNALLLVVGYTDSTGSYDFNQQLSEKRASRVVNYLQQACHWKPYRMLTPTGMAEADPLASNDTIEGKAQNRRVAVNILVSKAVDGF
ncbi:OmpA family protein [Novosphingobium naphthalenivorans]|uniref:OmpA family protein n=1 Tax=Novosphingobium naphthalenivorans TaxID=273168 RepID=UPI0008325ADC|nr:OmpA family protein [Novosphingobium naphthalenivorans]